MSKEYFKRETETAKVDPSRFPDREPGSGSGSPGSTLKDAIAENAKGPKKVEGDAGTVEQHSLRDQIEAERFLQSQKATQRPGLGIRLHKIAADGTT